ncbi:MAG: hypothetical protein ACYTEZ_14625 [Planctomycetota bacterium]|jgi:hypothetical protein
MGDAGGARARTPRREADIVRFETERLRSGLYRHRAVKFIMLLNGQQIGVRWGSTGFLGKP